MAEHPKDPDFFKIKRSRKHPEHITNCKTGYYRDNGKYVQVHHIVCVSSVQDSYIYDQLKNDNDFMIVRKCLMVTEWNINSGHNCIGLPLKRAFVSRPPRKSGGLPCHLVDHNHYTKNMNADLNKKVWQTALEKAEECKVNYQGYRCRNLKIAVISGEAGLRLVAKKIVERNTAGEIAIIW